MLEGKLVGRTEKPIKTSVYSLVDDLPASFVERLMQTVSWENREQWIVNKTYDQKPLFFTNGTRSVCFALTDEEKTTLSTTTLLPLQATQLKGLIYRPTRVEGEMRFNDGEIQTPVTKRFEEHSIHFVKVCEDGIIRSDRRTPDVPRGGVLLSTIEKIVANISIGRRKGIVAPHPIGFGIFDNMDYKGQQVGFLITGIYDSWNARLLDFFDTVMYRNPNMPPDEAGQEMGVSGPHPSVVERHGLPKDFLAKAPMCQMQRFADMLNERAEENVIELYTLYGKGLSHSHQNGMSFYNPHADNVLPIGNKLAMYDWEHTVNFSPLPPQMQVGYACMDIRNAFNQLGVYIRNSSETSAPALGSTAEFVNPYKTILAGYGMPQDQAEFLGRNFERHIRLLGEVEHIFLDRCLYPAIARALFN